MAAIHPDAPATAVPAPIPAALRYLQEVRALTGRNLLRILRSPERIMFSLITPVLTTLLFRYVFGGAIGGMLGISYARYLIPGVGVQVITLAAVTSGFAIADDLSTGYFYRLRTLPAARSAVLLARVCADAVNAATQLVVLLAVGFAVGFRTGSAAGLLAGCLVLLLFGVSLALAFAAVGLWVGRADAINAIAMPFVFPLTFASSAFVPPSTMPGWLRGFAGHQPVSVACESLRSLVLGDADTAAVRAGFFGGQSGVQLVLQSVLWSAAIAAGALALALHRYRRLSG